MTKFLRNLYQILGLCISMPIWFYLMHVMLTAAHADKLAWFLFWVYVPVSILLQLISRATENAYLDDRFDRWCEKRGRL